MALSNDEFDDLKRKAASRFQPLKADPLTPDQPAHSGIDAPGTIRDFGSDLQARFAQGVQEGLEADRSLPEAALGVTPFGVPNALVKAATGKSVTDVIPKPPVLSKEAQDRAKNPKTVMGKWLGGGAEGVGQMVTMPMLPEAGLARNIVAGLGMGEGSDLLGKAFGGIFGYFGGEQWEKYGRAAGSFIGGGVGSEANAIRMGILKEGAAGVRGAVKNIYASSRETLAKRRLGDTRSMWEIFSSEFGSTKAATKGLIQEFTNRNLANTIRRNIHASGFAQQFVEDAKISGMDVRPWGLGERTLVPSITEAIAGARPESHAAAEEIFTRASNMKTAIKDVYQNLRFKAGVPASPVGIQASAEAFRAITQAKVDGLTKEVGDVTQRFHKLDSVERDKLGEAVHKARDTMRDDAYKVAEGKYADAEKAFDAEGVKIEVPGVREEATQILKDFYPGQVDPRKVPAIVRNLLAATKAAGKEGAEEGAGLILPKGLAEETTAAKAAKDAQAAEDEAKGRPLTLKEANDLYKALGEAGTKALGAENNVGFRQSIALQHRLRDAIDGSKASPQAKEAYTEALRFYAEDYAPRFQEGVGKALGKERGGAMEGREVIPNEVVIDHILGGAAAKTLPTALHEADRLFATNPEGLKKLITIGVSNRFRDVLDKKFNADGFERDVEAFKSKYKAALDRVPELADKINNESARIYGLQLDKAAEIKRYEDIMKGPVTKSVGWQQAKDMFQEALGNPDKMHDLLAATKGVAAKELVKEMFEQADPFKGGDYDAQALLKMISAGKSSPDAPSSMRILFNAAYGPKDAQHHIDTLEAIARFVLRQEATDPRNLQVGQILKLEPVKQATGSTGASIISSIRAQAAGNTSSAYVAVLTTSRFVNMKIQSALTNAMHTSLYDPDMADAILEMSAKPANEPLSKSAAVKVGFDKIKDATGKNILQRMIDVGYVKDYVARGIIAGGEQSKRETDDPYSRENLRRKRREEAMKGN